MTGKFATTLTGLVGSQIQGSRSPEMHVVEAESLGLRLAYQLFDFERAGWSDESFPAVLDALERAGFSGVNVTHPFKQLAIASIDELDNDARLIGAINTILFRGGRRIGFNTDYLGFSQGLERQLGKIALDRVVQFGAGGAGAATAMAILDNGCRELGLYDRDRRRAEDLADRLAGSFADRHIHVLTSPEAAVTVADGIINATPIGMTGYPGMVIPAELLRATMWVADVVYFPIETELLRNARLAGCRTADGGSMAVFQAAKAFDLFTGHIADRERMMARFEQSQPTDMS